MAKRKSTAPENDKSANPKDFWATPEVAVLPLIQYLLPGTSFIEPCAGDGALRDALVARGFPCARAIDIEPRGPGIDKCDALDVDIVGATVVITNPPYSEDLVVPLINHWIRSGEPDEEIEVWLLIPLDWIANLWFAPFAPHVRKIVPIGRVKWIADSPSSGYENYAWVWFERGETSFIEPRLRKDKQARLDRKRAEERLLG